MMKSSENSEELSSNINLIYKEKGIDFFINFLKIHDIDSYESLHKNDHYRILRAYEYYKSSGEPISKAKELLNEKEPYNFAINRFPHWKIHHIYLNIPKEEHFKIICERTQEMLNNGLIEEVQSILEKFTGKEKPLQSIGYIETLQYLQNQFNNYEEYKERISISNRQLAKAQKTFFNKIKPKKSYHPKTDQKDILNDIELFLD